MAVIIKAIEATVTPDGRLETAEPLRFKRPTKVILTMALDDDDLDLATASEVAWADDWNNSDEDEAWASLQEAK